MGNSEKFPWDDNNFANINSFTLEINPVWQDPSSSNAEILICGDLNINLHKLNCGIGIP